MNTTYAVYTGSRGKADGFPSRLTLYLAPISSQYEANRARRNALSSGARFAVVVPFIELGTGPDWSPTHNQIIPVADPSA